ncbi:MAG: PAS domain-containing sensor histidine kinase [Phenylobacterium zucineum]|nr:MAG: PAS domain-containing sensor histidine kinase [Phenylobacterium zucineum]
MIPAVRPFEVHFSRAARVWQLVRARYALAGAYSLALVLTAIAILLAASPPGTGPLAPASRNILVILGLNLVLIFFLAATVGIRLLELLDAQSRDAGARLHLRFVTTFAFAAMAPALVVFFFSGVLVNRGVDDWFSTRVQTVVENSATVFRSYMDEQKRYVSDHVALMSEELNRASGALQTSPVTFSHFLAQQATDQGFQAAYLIDREGRILARAEIGKAPAYAVPPESGFKAADEGDIFVSSDLSRSLYRLRSYANAYLYLSRPIENGIVENLTEAEASLGSYREAALSRQRIQTVFALSYAETALLVLVGAVWLGMTAANAISGPVSRLVQAAGKVAGGDLSARVDADNDPEEIAVLSHAFNNMTRDLEHQQHALTLASDEAQQRSRFIETVLSEVSAGVLATDSAGNISAANRQAVTLLDLPGDRGHGLGLEHVAPELVSIARDARLAGIAEGEVDVSRSKETRRLRVRASRSEEGLVLTFDDITRLVSAQRNAAWRDVARRIAHEIKNPLTPIQLSAERIRRKFRGGIQPGDLETFDRCTETIVRQVGDIGRMVDEFSSFARMPTPNFARHDLTELVREAVFAQRVANPDIDIALIEPVRTYEVQADGRMIAQALTNVLKNAAEAVMARTSKMPEPPGRITVVIARSQRNITVTIEDNGLGLPIKDRDRLTEPYVTTREKGTGLGLAIVKRILEDHGGELVLMDAVNSPGARAILTIPSSPGDLGEALIAGSNLEVPHGG